MVGEYGRTVNIFQEKRKQGVKDFLDTENGHTLIIIPLPWAPKIHETSSDKRALHASSWCRKSTNSSYDQGSFKSLSYNHDFQRGLVKTMWEKEKMLVTSIFAFSPTMFSTLLKANFNFSVTFFCQLQMLSI